MKRIHRTLEDYQDILHLPHHVSTDRTQMPAVDRAAQFSPFAGVVGHEAAVRETARYTEVKKELDEMEKAVVDEALREIEARLQEIPEVEIVYFEPDDLKAGGSYQTKVGTVRRLDTHRRAILFSDGTEIAVDEIYSVVQL